jgi:hypothetical protein
MEAVSHSYITLHPIPLNFLKYEEFFYHSSIIAELYRVNAYGLSLKKNKHWSMAFWSYSTGT